MARDSSPPTRRRALVALVASIPALAAARVAVARPHLVAASKHAPQAASHQSELSSIAAAAESSELLGDVAPGARLGRCHVIEIRPVRHGSIAIVMRAPSGRRFQLDVLRDDGASRGAVGSAPGLAIYVSNEGDGGTPTDEEQGLAAMALGRVLSRRLREGARVPAMLSLSERERLFPEGLFRA